MPTQLVAKGMSESQSSKCMFVHITTELMCPVARNR